jgi:hypothetical protein
MLAAMAAHGSPFSVEQLRKLSFLFNHEAARFGPDLLHFVLRYGHYDVDIDAHLKTLRRANFIVSHPALTNGVMLTSAGRERGFAVLDALRPEARDYFLRAASFVRSVSFPALASIVEAADARASAHEANPTGSKSGAGSA